MEKHVRRPDAGEKSASTSPRRPLKPLPRSAALTRAEERLLERLRRLAPALLPAGPLLAEVELLAERERGRRGAVGSRPHQLGWYLSLMLCKVLDLAERAVAEGRDLEWVIPPGDTRDQTPVLRLMPYPDPDAEEAMALVYFVKARNESAHLGSLERGAR